MRASLPHLPSLLAEQAAPKLRHLAAKLQQQSQFKAPPKHQRVLIGFFKHSSSIKADIRLSGLDRLAGSTQRFSTRAREGSKPKKAVMRDEQSTLSLKANGNSLHSSLEPPNVSGTDLHIELPSLSDQVKERQAALPSISQPSSNRSKSAHGDAPKGVPVFVMLPLDTVSSDGQFRYANSRWFAAALERLEKSGVHGMAVDVWWGAVERRPRQYDWNGYSQVFDAVKAAGLKLQAVMSFHACGGNVGDSAQVPLPSWVLKAGEQDPDIFFTDRPRDSRVGNRNREYISIFADDAPRVLAGRSPLECYADFMHAFREAFIVDLGTTIEEVVVGTGPCGELRYPSYVEANGWRFPGVGELQCYDRRALASLAQAAKEKGHPEWGYTGPHDAGTYTSTPEETGFFRGWGGSWDTPYGQFFLSWYGGALIKHGERMVSMAASVFNTFHPERCTLTNHMNSSQSIVNVGPLYASPGGAQAPSSPAELGTPTMSSDSVPGSERLLSERVYSTGDLNQSSVGRTISTLSAMSEGSAAESSGSDTDPVVEAGSRTALQVGEPANQEAQNGLPQQSPAKPTQPHAGTEASKASIQRPELDRPPGNSGSLLDGANQQMTTSARSENGQQRPPRTPDFPSGAPVEVTLKVAGIHWWYRTRSHAAELTAGYYNTASRDGYNAMIEICAKHGAGLTLTCVEMCDAQHPPVALCGPEGLLRQVREAAAAAGVLMAGENALPCFSPGHVDSVALERIVYNTQAWSPPLQEASLREAMYRSPSASSLANSASSTDTLVGSGTNPASASAPDLPSKAQGAGVGLRPGVSSSLPQSELPMMRAFTFLRLTQEMLHPSYQATWLRFMHRMRNNSVRAIASQTSTSRVSTGLKPLAPIQRPVSSPQPPPSQTSLQRKGSLFVPNEKGEMVPADNYLEELARQNPNWRQ